MMMLVHSTYAKDCAVGRGGGGGEGGGLVAN